MAKKYKKRFVLHSGCFTINMKNLTIDRYHKTGGFKDRVGGFESSNDLWNFVIKYEK